MDASINHDILARYVSLPPLAGDQHPQGVLPLEAQALNESSRLGPQALGPLLLSKSANGRDDPHEAEAAQEARVAPGQGA